MNPILTIRKGIAGFAACFCLLAASVTAVAQGHGEGRSQAMEQDSLEVLLYFRKGYSVFEPAYKNNGERLMKFIREVDFKDTLHIRGTASPEGEWELNDRLSRKRAGSLRAYIMENASIEGPVLLVGGDGIDWAGLRSMATASRMPHKERVLDVIGKVLSGKIAPENANKSLIYIGDGEAWKYMYEHFFPQLRTVSFRTWGDPPPTIIGHRPGAEYIGDNTSEEQPAVPEVENEGTASSDGDGNSIEEEGGTESGMPEAESGCTEAEGEPIGEPKMEKMKDEPFHRLALKTNLLYDLALMPNLELEYLINEHWSVSLEGDVAWWKNAGKHQYYQTLILSPECRWWFKTFKPWHGHYLGIMAGGGLYDLENKRTGYKGEAGFAGLTYGFMWPVSRNLSFDAELGAGYMYTKYEEYEPVDNHYVYQRTRSMNYFGPLKLKFSLVWRFADVAGKKKGGSK